MSCTGSVSVSAHFRKNIDDEIEITKAELPFELNIQIGVLTVASMIELLARQVR